MGDDTKKVKKKCCYKFKKQGKHCSSCPLTTEGLGKEAKKEKSKDKEKKKGGKEKK
jgi:hypothetical protein